MALARMPTHKPTHLALLLAASVLLLAGTGLLFAEEPTRSAEGEPYAPYLPGTEPDHVASVRVLTLDGGRPVPVAGARLTGWSELAHPSHLVGSRLVTEATTDALGFANLSWPREDEVPPFHWLAEAPGMAVRTFHPFTGRHVFLARGAPFAVRLLSPTGQSFEGARVEYYIYGCPHSPAAREGTTDDDGVVVFADLPVPEDPNADPHNEWGQLWVTGAGVAHRRHGLPSQRRSEPPPAIVTDAGRSASGVVLDAEGRGRSGIVVRQHGYPRGPAVQTDVEGRFHLEGLAASGLGLAFYDPDDLLPDAPNAFVEDFESDVPLRLVLHAGRASALAEDEPRHLVEVSVRTRAIEPPSPADDVPVRFVRLEDGFVATGETGDPSPGLLRALLPPGRYRVEVGGGFSDVVAGRAALDVPAEGPLRFVLDPQPVLVIRGLDPVDPEGVLLRLPEAWALVNDAPNGLLHLPPDVPAWIEVDRGGPHFVPVGEAQGGLRLATVPPLSAFRVALRVVSADPARPLEDGAYVDWAGGIGEDLPAEEEEDGRFTLVTGRGGPRAIEIRAHGFQERTVPLTLGPDPEIVDLGAVALHPLEPRVLRVRPPAEVPWEDLELHWGPRGEHGNELVRDGGTFELELGPRPEPAVLGGRDLYPHPVLLGRDGPLEVVLPAGEVVLRVRDVHGQPLDAVAYVDHVRVEGEGDLVLRAVPAGPHTVVVGAKDHLGEVRRIALDEGETRELDFVLPPR